MSSQAREALDDSVYDANETMEAKIGVARPPTSAVASMPWSWGLLFMAGMRRCEVNALRCADMVDAAVGVERRMTAQSGRVRLANSHTWPTPSAPFAR